MEGLGMNLKALTVAAVMSLGMSNLGNAASIDCSGDNVSINLEYSDRASMGSLVFNGSSYNVWIDMNNGVGAASSGEVSLVISQGPAGKNRGEFVTGGKTYMVSCSVTD